MRLIGNIYTGLIEINKTTKNAKDAGEEARLTIL